jgi:hypothetical protein
MLNFVEMFLVWIGMDQVRAVIQAARRWILIAETRVQSRVTSNKIHGGPSGTGAGFSPSSLAFLC